MKKPVLYIIHGWTYTVTPWHRTITLLEKQGIKVEMLHVPGLTSPSRKVWTIEDYVKWAERHIPKGSVALGHSNGGRILLNLCSEKPDYLQHLILLDAAGVYESSGKRDVARTLSKRLGFLKKIPGLTKVWHKLTGATDYDQAPENMKATLANMLESDKKLDLTKVTTPTSILWGAADSVTPPHQAEIMHEKIKNSTLEMHRGWTHAPYLSHPTELAKAIFRAYKKPPEVAPKVEVTQAAEVSASMALKKASEPVVPSTAEVSASMAFKKAAGPVAADVTKVSAAYAVPSGKKGLRPSVVAEMKGVEYEKADLELPRQREIIATSSVPKVGKIEKIKRAAKRKRNARKINKARKQAKKVATRSAKKATAASSRVPAASKPLTTTGASAAKTSARKIGASAKASTTGTASAKPAKTLKGIRK